MVPVLFVVFHLFILTGMVSVKGNSTRFYYMNLMPFVRLVINLYTPYLVKDILHVLIPFLCLGLRVIGT